jgi:SH3 domain-containing YSC84-like protein 1
MKRNSLWFAGHLVCPSVILLAFACLSWGTERERKEIGKRLDAAATVLGEIMTTPDKAIPGQVLKEAKCIVVVPGIVRVALGIGARRGKGVATCRTTKGWSAPAPVGFREGSVGFQIGGMSVDLIMLVMNQDAANRLLSSTVKIGGDISGTAGPVGPNVSNNPGWRNSEILSYSKSRGAFVGIDVKGAALKQDKSGTIGLYGRYIPFGSILSGKVRPPADSDHFLTAIRKYTGTASRG